MMKENLESHGYLIMDLQDTSVNQWEASQYIVYQDNNGEIYTHPLADPDAPGFKPTENAEESSDLIFEKWSPADEGEKLSEPSNQPLSNNPVDSDSLAEPQKEGEENAPQINSTKREEIVPELEGSKISGRRQKIQRVVPE